MSEDRFVDAPPSGAEGWREVWQNDRRFRPRKSAFGFLLRFFQRLLDRATRAERDRQRDFNLALLDLVSDLRSDIGRIRDDLKRDIETVQRDVRVADEALAEELRKIRELIPIAAKRNDSLIAALDQKIETVAVRVRDVTNPVVASSSVASDFLYRRLEDGLRGAVDVADYVARAREPVIDVGCGRGEFLIACRAAGIAASLDEGPDYTVEHLRKRAVRKRFVAAASTLIGALFCLVTMAQGIAQWELWTGKKSPEAPMRRAVVAALRAKEIAPEKKRGTSA